MKAVLSDKVYKKQLLFRYHRLKSQHWPQNESSAGAETVHWSFDERWTRQKTKKRKAEEEKMGKEGEDGAKEDEGAAAAAAAEG